ncbi:MAG: hypothetical protein WA131_04945 [Desulfitobacteriaceae bacterium]
MSERIEDIEPLSPVQRTRKIVFKKRDSQELMYEYQLKRSHKSGLRKANREDNQKPQSAENEVSNSSDKDMTDIKTDLHNRNAFDRITTLGQ